MDIPGSILKLNDIEVATEGPVSEQLLSKIGANINALTDQFGKSQTFTSSGTFTVPENVTRVLVFGCGGGGGGRWGIDISGVVGGPGGGGAVPSLAYLPVTPFATIPVVIGPGGIGGNGATLTEPTNGSDTTFGSYLFQGGLGAVFSLPSAGPPPASVTPLGARTAGGNRGAAGGRSIYALGGLAGGAGIVHGGGGGAGFGPGGNGGAGSSGPTGGSAGANAAANSGAGGGGGGSNSSTNFSGGNGGSGIIVVFW